MDAETFAIALTAQRELPRMVGTGSRCRTC